MRDPLTVFIPHCSDLLTDHLPHGDGLIAHGFITNLARRGHILHVATEKVSLRRPLAENVTVYEIPLASSGMILRRIEYMIRVRRLLTQLRKTIHFDLMHQLNPVFTGLSYSLKGSRLPLVLGTYVPRWPDDPESMPSKDWRNRALSMARNFISQAQQRQADALLLTTPAAWDRIPNPEPLHDRVHFLPHGIDTNLFSPSSEQDPSEACHRDECPPSILFFAGILRRKGIFTLIDAFPSIAREIPETKLIVAGDGADLAEAQRRVTELGFTGRVMFLGKQERRDAPALYRNCTVYCLPSFGEPYATTLIEAMSCGKAVVVTDAGGLTHIVSPEGGKRVPMGDVSALSTALVDLLRNPEQRAAMGRHNRRVAETLMSWNTVVQRLEEIYENTIQRHSATQRGNRATETLPVARSSDTSFRGQV
jgi:L-malate glycosyltransferase